jgi:DNA repair exonuclease SbcCD nuclease subunit
MRILHFADVHLDRPFVGLSRAAARQRREDLADAFRRCLTAARDQNVDAVTIGGDLWEDENVTPDTRASVAYELGLLGLPVVLVTGNHDPYLRGGTYQRTDWPANVVVVKSAEPTEVPLGDVSVWAASWTERSLSTEFLRDFRVPDDGRTHMLLIHGTANDERFATTTTHGGFDPADAKQAGLKVVLSGHIHRASYQNGVVYPGSPEPLDHSETGRHCYALVEIDGGQLDIQLVDVNRRRYVSLAVDCSDAVASADVETRVRERLEVQRDPDTILKVVLQGETAPDCAIDRATLTARLEQDFAAAAVDDLTEQRVDYAELARRHSADGLFAASLLERIERAGDQRGRQVLEMALRAGVRAMNGRKDVLRVG